MLYAITGIDADNSDALRLKHRSEHIERLNKLRDKGQLILAGAHPAIDSNTPGQAGMTGSLIVAEFPSIAAANAWAQKDPFYRAGVFINISVKPFKQVLP